MSSENNFFKRLSFFKKKIALVSEFNKKISYATLIKKLKNFLTIFVKKKVWFLIGKTILRPLLHMYLLLIKVILFSL